MKKLSILILSILTIFLFSGCTATSGGVINIELAFVNAKGNALGGTVATNNPHTKDGVPYLVKSFTIDIDKSKMATTVKGVRYD